MSIKYDTYNNHEIGGSKGQRNTSNVCHIVHSIYIVTVDYEQHYNTAMYYFHDVATLFSVNILQQGNANNHMVHAVEY